MTCLWAGSMTSLHNIPQLSKVIIYIVMLLHSKTKQSKKPWRHLSILRSTWYASETHLPCHLSSSRVIFLLLLFFFSSSREEMVYLYNEQDIVKQKIRHTTILKFFKPFLVSRLTYARDVWSLKRRLVAVFL